MHDPLTEAFRWPTPWSKRDLATLDMDKYRSPKIVIWHRDPESDGTDDSCGWFMPKVPKDVMDRLHGNAVEGECSWDELDQRVIGYRVALRHARPWWRHPRWHVHHWRIQLPAWQRLQRSRQRCVLCNERFGMNPGPIARDSRGIMHMAHIAQSATPARSSV